MIDGILFTRDFLLEGVSQTRAWQALGDDYIAALRSFADDKIRALQRRKSPSEAQTEEDVVYPVLERVGWAHKDVQPNASVKARSDVPDALLFADLEAKNVAGGLQPWQRFQHGLCVVEAKRWERPLDRAGGNAETGTPSSQMLRYLRRVEESTQGGLRWGILTNGRLWRLYFYSAQTIADYLEIDLGKALGLPDCPFDLLDKRPDVFSDDEGWRDHAMRLFALFFGREAFLPEAAGETFHQLALRQGKRWEAKVAQTLSRTVFGTVFPALTTALAAADFGRPATLTTAYVEDVRQGALVLLYRLLFVLYAEDRDLLPDERGPYAPYCLTRIRLEIAARPSGNRYPSGVVTLWPRLTTIFSAIATGNDDLGIPPYNGGLFELAAAPILGRVQLDDRIVATVLFGLSHEPADADRPPKYINYRDLTVQQLGAVYERILEFGLRLTPAGTIEPDADAEARHKSGSYYTPEDLVALVIARTVGPLIEERTQVFYADAARLASDKRPIETRLAELALSDPAIAILALRVCDPAMGSGHFLVSLVDWLVGKVRAAMAEATASVAWAIYTSPLVPRIEAIRQRILGEARAHRWPLVENQLDDPQIIRRMVLKRVVHGVDKNPMAVELAKVALWLHSFTVGAPLSFLDHHLRAGDSVLGAWVHRTVSELRQRGALFNFGQIARVENVSGIMAEIEETTDNDVVEVARSKSKYDVIQTVTDPIAALFSVLTAERVMGVFATVPKSAPDMRKMAGKSDKQLARAQAELAAFERAAALQLVLEGTFGDPLRIAQGTERVAPPELASQLALTADVPPDQSSLFPTISVDDRRRLLADSLIQEARALAARHGFLHWEVAFPNVWSHLTSSAPRGGFDAVIGNPPFVRQELLEDGAKRALRAGYASYDGAADLYVYFQEQGLRLLRPGGRLGYVLTNKWLKAGYAENVRGLFAEEGWLEFVADFGHAKHFFPDADVFPSVLVVRKPDASTAPGESEVCAIPRDAVPRKGLAGTVREATFPLPRAMFTKEAWVLEPKPVMDLLAKIKRNGVPLAEYAGVKPYRGVLTGLNEAFLIDTAKRDELVRADPKCADIIKPYLRGQDIERWWSPDSGLFMIVLKSSGNHAWPWANAGDENEAEAIFAKTYPSIHLQMSKYAEWVDQKSKKRIGLKHREDHGRFWWELRSCDYYHEFLPEKIMFQAIQFAPRYTLDGEGRFGNNKTYILTSSSRALLTCLNSPLSWWVAWRRFLHLKDEALSNDAVKLVKMPMPVAQTALEVATTTAVDDLVRLNSKKFEATAAIHDWLRYEFGLAKTGGALAEPQKLDADAFVAAVRKALPRSRALSAAEIARLKREHADTIDPARRAAGEILVLERRLSDLVNAAYDGAQTEVRGPGYLKGAQRRRRRPVRLATAVARNVGRRRHGAERCRRMPTASALGDAGRRLRTTSYVAVRRHRRACRRTGDGGRPSKTAVGHGPCGRPVAQKPLAGKPRRIGAAASFSPCCRSPCAQLERDLMAASHVCR